MRDAKKDMAAALRRMAQLDEYLAVPDNVRRMLQRVIDNCTGEGIRPMAGSDELAACDVGADVVRRIRNALAGARSQGIEVDEIRMASVVEQAIKAGLEAAGMLTSDSRAREPSLLGCHLTIASAGELPGEHVVELRRGGHSVGAVVLDKAKLPIGSGEQA